MKPSICINETILPLIIILVTIATYTHTAYMDPVNIFEKTYHWILAAGGSNGVPAPSNSCVHITVNYTNRHDFCVYNALNHSITKTRVYRINGINEDKVTVIKTVGPVIPFAEKEFELNLFYPEAYYSTACWDQKTHEIRPFIYVVHLDRFTMNNPNYLLLVGTDTRFPHPQVEVALLTKIKEPKATVMDMVNYHNINTPRYFYEYDETLPPLEIKCASDFNERKRKEKLTKKTKVYPMETTDGPGPNYESSYECTNKPFFDWFG